MNRRVLGNIGGGQTHHAARYIHTYIYTNIPRDVGHTSPSMWGSLRLAPIIVYGFVHEACLLLTKSTSPMYRNSPAVMARIHSLAVSVFRLTATPMNNPMIAVRDDMKLNNRAVNQWIPDLMRTA